MTARNRKLVGTLAILAFLAGYAGLAVKIADHLPAHPAVKLVYFLIFGTAWGLPLLPLLSWMNGGPKPKG